VFNIPQTFVADRYGQSAESMNALLMGIFIEIRRWRVELWLVRSTSFICVPREGCSVLVYCKLLADTPYSSVQPIRVYDLSELSVCDVYISLNGQLETELCVITYKCSIAVTL